MDPSKVVLEAVRLGLPATATAAEILDRVYSLQAERDAAVAKAEVQHRVSLLPYPIQRPRNVKSTCHYDW